MAAVVALGGAAALWSWNATPRESPREAVHSLPHERRLEEPDENWPALFGPRNDSTAPAAGLCLDWPETGPPVVWRRPIGTGYSSPVVWGGRLVVLHRQGDEEVLQCLDALSGESLWHVRGPTGYECRYRYSNGPYSTPVIDGGRVYAVGAEGRFYCVDLETGRLVWQRHLTRDYDVPPGHFAVAASPLLEDGRLIFNLGGRSTESGIVALNAATGATIWKSTDHGAGYATPRAATIHGRRLVFVLTLDGLVCLDPADGRVFWTHRFSSQNPEHANATSPWVDGDLVLVSVYQKGALCARVLPDGGREIVWQKRRGLQSQFCTLIGSAGHVYGFDAATRSLACIRLADGERRWQWPPPDHEGITRGQMLAVGGQLIVLGDCGRLAVLEATPGAVEPMALTDVLLKPPCYASPALAAGKLYVRNEQEVICIDCGAHSRSD